MTVDFHSHILPAIDDGSLDVDMSAKMIEMEVKSGVDHIIATPHFYLQQQSLDSFLENRGAAMDKLSGIASDMKVHITPAAEVLYTYSLESIDLSKLCIGNSRYMLIELPYQPLTEGFIRSFKSFFGSIYPDIRLVLAHAERYLSFADEDSLMEILDSDILVQVNSGSMKLFSKSLSFINRLIDHGMVHFVGTDCHNITTRPPNMEIARKAIGRKFSPDCFEQMQMNAAVVLSGKTL